MTHEIATIDDAPRSHNAAMVGRRPQAIVPQTMDDAYRLGKAICLAGMAPKGMDTPEKCMIAIMRGMEVGLTPMQSLDKIAIVNGRPTIWGDGALGLVRGSGICDWVEETLEGQGDARVATCRVQRRGEPKPTVRTFSVADAKTAKLWGKKGANGQDTPWITMPDRMLRMRARAFALRDGFADVLGGLYLKEEIDNDGEADRGPRRVAPPVDSTPGIELTTADPERSVDRQASPETPQQPRRAPSAAAAPQPQPEAAKPAQQPASTSHYDPEKVRKAFAKAASEAKDRDELNEAWERIVGPLCDDEPMLQRGTPDRADLDRIYDVRAAEVDGQEGAMP